MEKLIVSAIQQPCGDEDYGVNLALSIAKIREAAAAKADLVVLPELHLGKYFCQIEDHSVFDWRNRFRVKRQIFCLR